MNTNVTWSIEPQGIAKVSSSGLVTAVAEGSATTTRIVSFYYSIDDGQSWKKYHRSNNITSMNHNAYGGFLSLRLGLFAIGEGKVKFRNFQYKKME